MLMGRPSVSKTPFSQRLTDARQALGYEHRKAFAVHLGMNAETLGGYERGDSFPDEAFLRRYKQEFSVNLDWLITGDGEMFSDPHPVDVNLSQPDDRLTEVPPPGMITIPRYDEVRASAGDGLAVLDETAMTRISVELRWLIELGASPTSTIILPAAGDSMEPTIFSGAPMFVDTSKREVRNGFIYVFNVNGDLVVKRIERLFDGSFDLISDNKNYPIRNLSQATVETLTVIGRVLASISTF